jgi:hypothetical protein
MTENKLLPLAPRDLEAHAMHNFQVVLGCKEAIWKSRVESDEHASRAQLDQEIWDYEWYVTPRTLLCYVLICNSYSNRYTRLNLPSQACCIWDDSDDESNSTQRPSITSFGNRRRTPLTFEKVDIGTLGEKPTVVRSIQVFIASGDGK